MNIGIDARMYGPRVGGGGLGRYVEELVKELQAIDHKNRYVLFLKKENFDTCVITNPNFEKRLADVHWYTLEEQIKLGRIIDRERLDLVHFPHWNVPLFLRTPFVVTIHDLILLDEPYSAKISTRHPWIFAVKYFVYKYVLACAIFRAKKIIAVSNATKNSLKQHFKKLNPKKIDVVYEGVTAFSEMVDLALDHPLTPSFSRRGDLQPYLLYVGNAFPHKNLECLLEAFTLLRQTHPDVKLILAGHESVFYNRLLETSKNSTSVAFYKNPTDKKLENLYRNATIFVYPSRREGFGLPPLEAMSFGVPVIASDIPSLREILGDAAVFFPPNDASHLTSVLSDLLVQPKKRTELIQKGFAQIKHYSWQKMANSIQTIYETCEKKTP